MARPTTFDQKQVIDCVVGQFWKHGFEGASMKHICDATGLQPGSIYAAFGNKRALFLTAIDAYFEQSMATLKSVLHGEGSPLQRIRALFEYTVGEICRRDSDGCMMVNALLEAPADDRELRERLAEKFLVLESEIRAVLTEAIARGELAPDKDPSVVAKLLVNNIYGLRVHSRLQPAGLAMAAMVDELLSSLQRHG